ncbi:hypothetical protein [Actinoplanes sp. RD1]|uniref:hypothetical protein n=1 Tax=Actinoplanes sp. RD1 TaxID=3064538 RepID=UPI00274229D2|nr:hypothetical protein [Actinoplanes sp. RD1]
MPDTEPLTTDPRGIRFLTYDTYLRDTPYTEAEKAYIRQYAAEHRDEIIAQVRENLRKLDGTPGSVVSLLTGLSIERINELGGMPDSH